MTGPAADINRAEGGRTVINGGKAPNNSNGTDEQEGWARTLARELANRYVASVLCSWRATGGSIPNLLPRLSDDQLAVTNSVNNTGNMFEKFSNLDIDSAGRGGEYVVQAGFGWTNGVLLWASNTFGDVLEASVCPDIQLVANVTGSGNATDANTTTSVNNDDTSAELPWVFKFVPSLVVGAFSLSSCCGPRRHDGRDSSR